MVSAVAPVGGECPLLASSSLRRLINIDRSISVPQSQVIVALRNVYWHPLARYPGPKVWAAFRLPYCFSLWRGTLVHDIHAIHQAYGDLVRVAPNEISIARSDGWNDVYCRRPGHQPFPKNPIWWGELPGRAPSVVSTPDAADHRRMRTLLSTCFTPSALQAQEPAVISHVDNLIDQLRKRCVEEDNKTAIVNIAEWLSFVVFDIIGDLGFGETFHCLDSNVMHPWVLELFSYSKVGALVAALRHYTFLFNIVMRCLPAKSLEASRKNFLWGVEKMHRRLDLDFQREDFVYRILQHGGLGDHGMSIAELENNMNLLIVAGSDTCATVLSGTVNYLVKTPEASQRLVLELRSSYRNSSEMTFSNLQKLPYLVAVVEEGLRLCPPNPSGLQHIVPFGGDLVCGGWLPGGVGTLVQIIPEATLIYRSAK